MMASPPNFLPRSPETNQAVTGLAGKRAIDKDQAKGLAEFFRMPVELFLCSSSPGEFLGSRSPSPNLPKLPVPETPDGETQSSESIGGFGDRLTLVQNSSRAWHLGQHLTGSLARLSHF